MKVVTDWELKASNVRSEIATIFNSYGFSEQIDPIDAVDTFLSWFEVSDAVDIAERIRDSRLSALASKLRDNGIPDEIEPESRCGLVAVRASDRLRIEALRTGLNEKMTEAQIRRTGADASILTKYGLNFESALEDFCTVISELEEASQSQSTIQSDINDINAQIIAATNSNDIETLQKALDDSIGRASIWIQRKAQSAANERVRNAIDTAVRNENTPEVIRTCNSWLSRLTKGRYGNLEVTGTSLSVHDTDDSNRRKLVTELSTGTKAHLALAVRLAVIESSETQGVRFPLFLDEVMATSDPDGSRAIAESLREIALDRQVIVMTNQPDDLNVLRTVLGPEIEEFTLARALPVPVGIPISSPVQVKRQVGVGLPLHSPVIRWSPILLMPILPDIDSTVETVGEAMGTAENQESAVIVAALDALRAFVKETYPVLNWESIATLELGGAEMQQRIREAFDQSELDASKFLENVNLIPRRRHLMVENLKEKLCEFGFFQELPTHEQLVGIAKSSLPEEYPQRMIIAEGLASVFRSYVSE